MIVDTELAFLLLLRFFQIGATLYAMKLVWQMRGDPLGPVVGFLLPLLAILLLFSVVNLSHDGRVADSRDLLWWAWLLYDLLFPLSIIGVVSNWRRLIPALIRAVEQQERRKGPHLG